MKYSKIILNKVKKKNIFADSVTSHFYGARTIPVSLRRAGDNMSPVFELPDSFVISQKRESDF